MKLSEPDYYKSVQFLDITDFEKLLMERIHRI